MISIPLPYPNKALWPNGRAHWRKKHQEIKKHRQWAYIAATAKYIEDGFEPDEKMKVKIKVYPKAKGPVPDEDNVVASCKAYLDGISDALGVNDKAFKSPLVEFNNDRQSMFVIQIGE